MRRRVADRAAVVGADRGVDVDPAPRGVGGIGRIDQVGEGERVPNVGAVGGIGFEAVFPVVAIAVELLE